MNTAHRDFDEFYGATFHGLRSQLYAYLGDRAYSYIQDATPHDNQVEVAINRP